MTGKRLRRLTAAAAIGFIALGAQIVAQPLAGADLPTDTQPFLINPGFVAATDGAAVGAHTSFTITCSSATSSPPWATDGSAPTCQGGRLTVYVTPNTYFYQRVDTSGNYCPSAPGCFYQQSTYDAVIVPGAQLRIGGFWTRVSYSQYQFSATYIHNPGTDIHDPPQLPRPTTPQDYDFSHRFVLDAQVKQTGTGVINGGYFWSQKWGMVVGNIPTTINPVTNADGYFNNAQVKAIAAAHQDPVTSDPQVGITTNDAGPAAQVTYGLPLTRYWVQRSDGNFYPASKDQTVSAIGDQLRVAGAYGWGDDGDWKFIALYVWKPVPGVQPGQYQFNITTQRPPGPSMTTTNVRETYTGSSLSGPGDVNPAGITLDTTWSLSGSSWQLTGNWQATRCTMADGTPIPGCSNPGTLSGTLSGSWDPSTGQVAANVVLTNGAGKFCGQNGTGTFSGTGAGTADSPPTGLNGGFTLAVVRDATVAC